MWSTPASTAARSTSSASLLSLDGPNTPSPASCIAPYPALRTRHGPSANDPPSSLTLPATLPPTQRPRAGEGLPGDPPSDLFMVTLEVVNGHHRIPVIRGAAVTRRASADRQDGRLARRR